MYFENVITYPKLDPQCDVQTMKYQTMNLTHFWVVWSLGTENQSRNNPIIN